MPGTTTDGAPYPLSSEPLKDGANAIQALAQWSDDLFVKDVYSNLPTAGKIGRRFYATDIGDLWLDVGTSWRFLLASAFTARTATSPQSVAGDNVPHNIATTLEENSVPTIFTSSTSGSGTIVTPSITGRVFAQANVVFTGTVGKLSLRKTNPGQPDTLLDERPISGDATFPLAAEFRLNANQSVFLQYTASSSSGGLLQVRNFSVYRMRG